VPVNALLLNDEEGERKQDEALASGDASARSKDSLDGTKEPAQEQAESAEERREVASEESAASGDALIPINSADLEQLQKLPGIGPAKAQAILDYRREHGPFRSPEELLNVKGIGQKTLEKMLPYLKLE
jgi:competence protein ComEA